ncbi:Inverted formin-2 [Trichinella nelsoni]|uniref:Inverted formin-2 n=1 Tax=Trichinella nelsoni TaxID=6336 RepID=A0A0V0S0F6_9BILA|nr:Inverted formin-2 [Trichinella nelsoni]
MIRKIADGSCCKQLTLFKTGKRRYHYCSALVVHFRQLLEQLFAAGQRTSPSLLNTHLSNGSAAGSDFVDPCTSNIFDDSMKTKYNRTMSTTTERRRKEAVEINLLDPKRSINVNIFLKQFRGGVEELANLIRCDRADEIGGPEKLRGMIKILPDQDEDKRIATVKFPLSFGKPLNPWIVACIIRPLVVGRGLPDPAR